MIVEHLPSQLTAGSLHTPERRPIAATKNDWTFYRFVQPRVSKTLARDLRCPSSRKQYITAVRWFKLVLCLGKSFNTHGEDVELLDFEELTGKGNAFVTSSVDPMSKPSSCPVTREGMHSLQCLSTFSSTCPSICTLRKGVSPAWKTTVPNHVYKALKTFTTLSCKADCVLNLEW